MFTWRFWRSTIERAVKTAAQAIIASGLVSTTVQGMSWADVGAIGAAAAIMSVITSLASTRVGDPETPEFLG